MVVEVEVRDPCSSSDVCTHEAGMALVVQAWLHEGQHSGHGEPQSLTLSDRIELLNNRVAVVVVWHERCACTEEQHTWVSVSAAQCTGSLHDSRVVLTKASLAPVFCRREVKLTSADS